MPRFESFSSGSAASLRRLRLIARHTLGEALHLRLPQLLLLAGAALVLAARGLQDFNFGTAELKFLGDFGLGAIGLVGTVLAALAMAQLFFGEIASGAAGCILARPVRRWEYVWGKFAGVAALLALFTAALGGALAGLLLWRGAQLGAAAFPLGALFCACVLQWLKLTLVAALTLLVCTYAGSALFASCAGLLLAGAAQLRPFAGDRGVLLFLRVCPNLGLFDADAVLAAGQPPPGPWLAGLVAYWAVYLLLLGGLASYVFKHREF